MLELENEAEYSVYSAYSVIQICTSLPTAILLQVLPTRKRKRKIIAWGVFILRVYLTES